MMFGVPPCHTVTTPCHSTYKCQLTAHIRNFPQAHATPIQFLPYLQHDHHNCVKCQVSSVPTIAIYRYQVRCCTIIYTLTCLQLQLGIRLSTTVTVTVTMVAPSVLKPSTREKETCSSLSLEVNPHHSLNDDAGDSGSADSLSTAPDSSSSVASPQHGLEQRVQELEEKLATLSLLLQQQRRVVRSISPPSITPPPSPPPDASSYLALESPAACRPPSHRTMDRRRRNLSFRVLHSPDSPRHDQGMSDLADSMFLPDGLPEDIHEGLVFQTESVSPIRSATEERPPKSLQSLDVGHTGTQLSITPSDTKAADSDIDINIDVDTNTATGTKVRILSPTKEIHDHVTTTSSSPPPSMEKADHVKSKWLDYLNSFQESHYDTDKQMEEFVKIPSAVEALLSFGFWICVDSFLYILTILPIRFVWSCLLLARFFAIRMVQKKVPEGPFRFHRR